MLLAELNGADRIDWRWGLIDASFAEAPEGGEETAGSNPTDRGKSGSKYPAPTHAQGIPLAATVTAANVNEVTQVFDVLTSMPPVGGKPAQAGEAGAAARRYRLRLRAGPAVVAVAGRNADIGRTWAGARQRPGRVPLVRGTDDLPAA